MSKDKIEQLVKLLEEWNKIESLYEDVGFVTTEVKVDKRAEKIEHLYEVIDGLQVYKRICHAFADTLENEIENAKKFDFAGLLQGMTYAEGIFAQIMNHYANQKEVK